MPFVRYYILYIIRPIVYVMYYILYYICGITCKILHIYIYYTLDIIHDILDGTADTAKASCDSTDTENKNIIN